MTSHREDDLERPDATIRCHTTTPSARAVRFSRTATRSTVVFLHGATLDHRSWAPQADALRNRCRVVVPDMRGHGASTGRFDFDAAVDDVIALLDRLPDAPVALVGLSLGANIAQEVVRRRPDAVQVLVAADTTCHTAVRHPLAVSLGVMAMRSPALLAGGDFAHHAARATATNPQVQRYVLEVNAHRSRRETLDIFTSLMSTALRAAPAYRLPVPTLLVHGELDRVGDIASSMPRWARREPLARYAVIPGAGHASNLDAPETFTALLEAFLTEAGIISRGRTRSLEASLARAVGH